MRTLSLTLYLALSETDIIPGIIRDIIIDIIPDIIPDIILDNIPDFFIYVLFRI